jgi:hypothetical protein
MAAKLRRADDLIIDRFYRGAIVLAAGECHLVDEALARVIDGVDSPSADAAERLVRLGIFVEENDA